MEITIRGTIHCRLTDTGSKSEGYRSTLADIEGNLYKLYRAGILPYSDNYFMEYDGLEAVVTGDFEEESGSLRVESIRLYTEDKEE